MRKLTGNGRGEERRGSAAREKEWDGTVLGGGRVHHEIGPSPWGGAGRCTCSQTRAFDALARAEEFEPD